VTAAEPIVAPHGAWRSPLDAGDAARAGHRYSALALTRDDEDRPVVWWAETRPAEGGRIAIVAAVGDAVAADVGPSTLRIRSRVNEYGGGATWLGDGSLWAVDDRAQRVVEQPLLGGRPPSPGDWSPRWATAEPPVPVGWRHAAGAVAAGRGWWVVERERHVARDGTPLDEPTNELAVVDRSTGDAVVAVGPGSPGGGDFAVAPTLSPDGTAMAWLRWDHPDMPWDAAELWIADLREVDSQAAPVVLVDARRVAGGRADERARALGRPVSVCLPTWDGDGRLWWCDDASGWWHLQHASEPGAPDEGAGDSAPRLVGDAREEVGEPRWVAGGSRYGVTDDGRVVFAAAADGLDSVWVVDRATGARTALPGPAFTHVERLVVDGATVALVAGSVDLPTSVWRVDLDSGSAVELRDTGAPIEQEWISRPRPVSFPTGSVAAPDGPETAHALFYPPASGDHAGPDGELPPLVIRIHGGPTAAARAELSASVQFWTTRGFAVVDVNYRGSVGYGRTYRDLLRGAWGVADVEDCLAAARHLAEAGVVDGGRCVIRGGSAGGFTALAALCFQAAWGYRDTIAAACSLYGVTDLAAMAADTHKFESRYLDSLVAPLPDGAEVYRERSPLHHAERIDRPVLLLQGTEDKVVPPSQAEVLVAALASNGVPHAYVRFPGEGHGFHRAETVVAALEAELGFYGRVLGFDPAGIDSPIELV
jgi:dipeptidyl aminopeptidase/acylaminoacyl peptidase